MALSARIPLLAAGLMVLLLVFATSLSARAARDRAGAEAVAASVGAPAQGPSSLRLRAVEPFESKAASPRALRTSRATRSPAAQTIRRAASTVATPPSKRRSAAAPPPGVRPAKLVRVKSGRSIAVRSRPGGRVIGRLDDRTEFGSRQVLSAVTTRGPWLGVASSARTDGRLGWVDGRSSAPRLTAAEVSIQADLSRRRVELRSGNRLLVRAPVTIGRPGSSTPTGRFAVTDKLNGRDMSPYYGCCILALSGTQPNLPASWSGGNRLAIHGTNDPGSIGAAASAGCLRAGESDIKRMMRRVPLGTPVEIRR